MNRMEKSVGGLGATRYGWTLACSKCTPSFSHRSPISALVYASTSATLAGMINFTRRCVLVLFARSKAPDHNALT